MTQEIWTIGHSNRRLDDFLRLLNMHAIALVADVRRFAGSRAHPHFNGPALAATLEQAGIGYRHWPHLGGRRGRRAADSPNTAWRVDAFNAYADYMATAEFESALEELMVLARARRTAIMCSEAVPWRCHRRLIADALLVRGWQVHDIIGGGPARPHALTSFAHLSQGRLTYPGQTLF